MKRKKRTWIWVVLGILCLYVAIVFIFGNGKNVFWSDLYKAKQGNARSQYEVGMDYLYGHGAKHNYPKAAQWLEKAAEQGYYKASLELSKMYENGTGVAKSADGALYWLTRAAEDGEPWVMNDLGDYYARGRYNGEPNYVMAFQCYQQAADRGHTNSLFEVGYCYYLGLGCEVDVVRAARYFEKAAAQGNIFAMNNIGFCYYNGIGVSKDQPNGEKWMKQSAEHNVDAAINNLAIAQSRAANVLHFCKNYGGEITFNLPTAYINSIGVEDAVTTTGDNWLDILIDLNIVGIKGDDVKVVAYFYDKDKESIRASLSQYQTPSGKASTSKIVTPRYDNSHYSKLSLGIPHNALSLANGKHKGYIRVGVYHMNTGEFLCTGNYEPFACTIRKPVAPERQFHNDPNAGGITPGSFQYNPNAYSSVGSFQYNPNAALSSGSFQYNPYASSSIFDDDDMSSIMSQSSNSHRLRYTEDRHPEYIDKIIDAPNYTGNDNSRYCPTCGTVSSAHTHVKQRVPGT